MTRAFGEGSISLFQASYKYLLGSIGNKAMTWRKYHSPKSIRQASESF